MKCYVGLRPPDAPNFLRQNLTIPTPDPDVPFVFGFSPFRHLIFAVLCFWHLSHKTNKDMGSYPYFFFV